MTQVKTFADFGIDLRGRSGVEVKTTCPRCSSARRKKSYPCLNVNTEKGLWNCWHCGWGGSLGNGEERRSEAPKFFRKPEYVVNRTDLPQKVVDYFATRGISQATLLRNCIGYGTQYFPQVEEERSCVMFPYLLDDEVINVKYRTHDKMFRLASGAERILYGLNDVCAVLIWVEGEMDKLSMEEAGFKNAVSVPDGAPAPNTRDYSNKFDFLDTERIKEVREHIIAVDNDEPGRKLQEELTRRLGKDRCLIVTWPEGCKDANEVLVKHGPEVLAKCVEGAAPVPIEGTHMPSSFRQRIMAAYAGEDSQRGVGTGWDCVDEHYTVLPGEWTLVTGIPGHGKSEWLDALSMNLAKQHGWNFAVYSPENFPGEYHSRKMLEKFVGKPFGPGRTERMSVAEVDDGIAFLDDHFTFLMPEQPSVDTLLQQAERLVTRKGIRGLILDPWNEIEHARANGQTETDYISLALSKVRRFSWKHGVHTWIVAHPAKLYKDNTTGDYPIPTPYDVSGSAHWRNKADNCITVYRHMKNDTKPIEIHVQKIRKKDVGKVGMAELRYDRVTGCYVDASKFPPPPVYSMSERNAA